jgi:hypothetical protein
MLADEGPKHLLKGIVLSQRLGTISSAAVLVTQSQFYTNTKLPENVSSCEGRFIQPQKFPQGYIGLLRNQK